MIVNKNDIDSDTNSMAIADMMSGLMIVFLFIAIAFMKQVSFTAEEYSRTKDEIYTALYSEFKDDLKFWKAELNKENLSVNFNEPEVLFNIGESDISPIFEEILNTFFPRYINILTSNKFYNELEEIRIEGHTSSDWSTKESKYQAYILNMKLSQDRSRNVLAYTLKLLPNNPHNDVTNLFTANGLSSSQIILDSNKNEDKEKSRRVAFKVKLKANQKIEQLLKGFEKYAS